MRAISIGWSKLVNDSATLHPSLRKRLLDMRFDVRRCLAIGRAMIRAGVR